MMPLFGKITLNKRKTKKQPAQQNAINPKEPSKIKIQTDMKTIATQTSILSSNKTDPNIHHLSHVVPSNNSSSRIQKDSTKKSSMDKLIMQTRQEKHEEYNLLKNKETTSSNPEPLMMGTRKD